MSERERERGGSSDILLYSTHTSIITIKISIFFSIITSSNSPRCILITKQQVHLQTWNRKKREVPLSLKSRNHHPLLFSGAKMLLMNCIVPILLLSLFSPLGLAMLNLTFPNPHPNPEEVAQEVQRYNAAFILPGACTFLPLLAHKLISTHTLHYVLISSPLVSFLKSWVFCCLS